MASLCVLITFSLPLAIFATVDNSRLDNRIPDRSCDVDKDGFLVNSPGVVDSLALLVVDGGVLRLVLNLALLLRDCVVLSSTNRFEL